jgi:hypothetical protein
MIKITFLLIVNLISCSRTESKEQRGKDYSALHAEAIGYCKKEGFNDEYYFLVDMSIHSGKNRFFVYDFNTKKVTDTNLVTHGSCDGFEANNLKYKQAKFSNRIDSHCTAAGKYKVGKRDYSSWGIKVKYWLDGLEESNSNARGRIVVLHSWSAVADNEIYPSYSPLSWGCPAVSDNFMKVLDKKLQKTNKPVLLWIVP